MFFSDLVYFSGVQKNIEFFQEILQESDHNQQETRQGEIHEIHKVCKFI